MEGPRRRRLATIAGLISATLQVIIWITIGFYLLAAFGVPLGPLIASAGIAGVALGFGAQTLVRDTLSGIFIPWKGQFDVGDVIDLATEGGPVTGTIEGLTLSITSVRQYDGTLSIVPNGSIRSPATTPAGGAARSSTSASPSRGPRARTAGCSTTCSRSSRTGAVAVVVREAPWSSASTRPPTSAQVVRVVAETRPEPPTGGSGCLRERIAARIVEKGHPRATGGRRHDRPTAS